MAIFSPLISTMQENQHTEFKSQWNDDCLKEICGFANSQGGLLYIGLNDQGQVIGVDNVSRLLTLVPDQTKNYMGIVCHVEQRIEDGLDFVCVNVSPSSTPISFRSKYYKRSGSNTMELSGPALNDFLQQKTGTYWDSGTETRATLDDLDEESIAKFRKDTQAKQRIERLNELTNEELLEKLGLVIDGAITRAGIILFGKNPSRFLPSARLRIGRFASESDIRHDNQLESNLIEIIYEVPKLLVSKYLTRMFSYQGVVRQETPEYPDLALREMLLHALIHRD